MSLADELGANFEDIPLSPAAAPGPMDIPQRSHEENIEGRVNGLCAKDIQISAAGSSLSITTSSADTVPDSLPTEDSQPTTADTSENVAVRHPPRKSNFVEQLSPNESASQLQSSKERIKFMALTNNRELIDRNADGFFDMGKRPRFTDAERHVKQSQGIAALQKTLSATVSDAAISNTRIACTTSSATTDSMKHASTLRQVSFAEPKGQRSNKIQGPCADSGIRAPAAPRFSLGRALVVAGHNKKLSEPSAPARFVRLPTDPVVSFRRNFADLGLKVDTEPDWYAIEADESLSILSSPEFDSAEGFTFKKLEPGINKVAASQCKFEAHLVDQCQEPSCPMRWAHAKGPYHHKGNRHNKIMTGLFGHSNPPPEIWNAYHRMVNLTSDGEMISPDGCSRSLVDEDSVIAFARLHFGKLNGISGAEFHRRYAGKHIASKISIGSSSTKSSQDQS